MDKQYEVARSLNATMEQLKSITACGAECQKEKKSDGLKREYENILLDKENVSSRLHDARKNYFTYAFGERYYNDSEKDRINVLAEENVDKLRTKHNTLLTGIRDQKSEVKENKMAIERCARDEQPRSLADILMRRLGLGWEPDQGLAQARLVAEAAAPHLGWSPERIDAEVAAYEKHLKLARRRPGDIPSVPT